MAQSRKRGGLEGGVGDLASFWDFASFPKHRFTKSIVLQKSIVSAKASFQPKHRFRQSIVSTKAPFQPKHRFPSRHRFSQGKASFRVNVSFSVEASFAMEQIKRTLHALMVFLFIRSHRHTAGNVAQQWCTSVVKHSTNWHELGHGSTIVFRF